MAKVSPMVKFLTCLTPLTEPVTVTKYIWAGTPAGLAQEMQSISLPLPQPAVTWVREVGAGAALTEAVIEAGAVTEEEKEVESVPVWVTDWVPEMEGVPEPEREEVPVPVIVLVGVLDGVGVTVLVKESETEDEKLVVSELDKL